MKFVGAQRSRAPTKLRLWTYKTRVRVFLVFIPVFRHVHTYVTHIPTHIPTHTHTVKVYARVRARLFVSNTRSSPALTVYRLAAAPSLSIPAGRPLPTRHFFDGTPRGRKFNLFVSRMKNTLYTRRIARRVRPTVFFSRYQKKIRAKSQEPGKKLF